MPTTAVGDPAAVMQVLDKELSVKNIKIRHESKIVLVDPVKRQIQLKDGEVIHYGHAINTAGLHAGTAN